MLALGHRQKCKIVYRSCSSIISSRTAYFDFFTPVSERFRLPLYKFFLNFVVGMCRGMWPSRCKECTTLNIWAALG